MTCTGATERGLFLASRAKTRRPASRNDPPNNRPAAGETRLIFAVVHAVRHLKPAALTPDVYVLSVFERGPTGGDCSVERVEDGLMQSGDLYRSQRVTQAIVAKAR